MSHRNQTPSFRPSLAARFDKLVTLYPLRRSALIPMLLYAQDEIGYLSDAVIAEVAARIGITELDVRNVISYYSLLRTKPAGKYHVQVCTNISCMLRGGNELFDHCKQASRHRQQGNHARRHLFSRRSGMHRSLQLGARRPGELRLPRKPDAGVDGQGARRVSGKPQESGANNGLPRLPSRCSASDLLPLRQGRGRDRQVHRAGWLQIRAQGHRAGPGRHHHRDEGLRTCAAAAAPASLPA